MLVLDAIKAASYLVEGLPAPGQWDRAEYCLALDKALQEAAMALRLTRTWMDPVMVLTGASALLLTPTPLLVLTVRNAMSKARILPTTEAFEDSMNPAWRDTSGVPDGWFLEAGNTLRLNRRVPADTPYEVQVIEAPIPMGQDADPVDPRIPANVLQAIHLGAAGYLFLQAGDNQDVNRAGLYLKQFEAAISQEK